MKSKKVKLPAPEYTRVEFEQGEVPPGFPPLGTLILCSGECIIVRYHYKQMRGDGVWDIRTKLLHLKNQVFFFVWFGHPKEISVVQEVDPS